MGHPLFYRSHFTTIMKFFALVAVFMAFLCAVLAMPYPFPYAMPDEPGYHPAPAYGGAIGRVKIQAYRGPSKPDGGYDTFAPWGFYVTQPKDDFAPYAYH